MINKTPKTPKTFKTPPRPPLRSRSALSLFLICCCVGLGFPAAAAAEPDGTVREADRHFQRGVALYVEADYHGALVEFTRAYTLAPNGTVLFNVGETQYQLRDYAAALATFQEYLVEAPANDAHRALAEANVKELRTRVGRLRIVTVPAGAEISIDDRVIGQTPFEKPIVVGIGQLSVKATMPGRSPVVRSVDVAAEDDVPVTIELAALAPVAKSESSSQPPVLVDRAPPAPIDTAAWRVAGWVTTGVLAGGAVVFGLLARNESNDLKNARLTVYPAMPGAFDTLANRTKTLSIVADSLAAAAIVVGGITLVSTVSAHGETHSAGVTVGLGSVGLDLRF
jgi:tetratricopeptide (TPR) repeat protein